MTSTITADVDGQFGALLRQWRVLRKLSQLALASRANVSARHVSFVETGRSAPSRSMVVKLAEQLDIPLRERNQLLVAAGYAPLYAESGMDEPRLHVVREAVRRVLAGHNPYPAFAVDRRWNLIEANRSASILLDGASPELLANPCNVLRLSLRPDGIGARIANVREWRDHVVHRLQAQLDAYPDDELQALLHELSELPMPPREACDDMTPDGGDPEVVVPMRLRTKDAELSLFSMVTTFGTPVDVTVQELAIESFFPADAASADYLNRNA